MSKNPQKDTASIPGAVNTHHVLYA